MQRTPSGSSNNLTMSKVVPHIKLEFNPSLNAAVSVGAIDRPGSGDADDGLLLIYNRIPKTASTTFMHLPYELCAENGFHVLLINNSRPQHYFSFQVGQIKSSAFLAKIDCCLSVVGCSGLCSQHHQVARQDAGHLPRPLCLHRVRSVRVRVISFT